jgi:glutathione synthase/RimK-type ligase-like ATP-grasp enzyme
MKITLLTDYKGNFGSKWKSTPYRSGYDQKYLTELFKKEGIEIDFFPLQKVNLSTQDWKGKIVLYTSSEEVGMHYKQYVEDICLALEMAGAILIPRFALLRANNNKVFMELNRQLHLPKELQTIDSLTYGSFEELFQDIQENRIQYPCVIKKASGAMSRGVFLAKNKEELIAYGKLVSKSGTLKTKFKESIRERKHAGYKQDTMYGNKFVIQPFIPGLKNDWKVIIYADRFFLLKRHTKDGDFRASGSGHNYKAGAASEFPPHMFDLVDQFYRSMDVPNFSIDFGYDGTNGYIFEYQGVYFGTSTTVRSNEYYIKKNNQWVTEPKSLDQEQEYVDSISNYLRKKGML